VNTLGQYTINLTFVLLGVIKDSLHVISLKIVWLDAYGNGSLETMVQVLIRTSLSVLEFLLRLLVNLVALQCYYLSGVDARLIVFRTLHSRDDGNQNRKQ
jgi:hypothetical protein